MSSKRATVYHSLDELPAAHASLFQEASNRQGFFFSLEWFRQLCRHGFSNGAQQRIFLVGPQEDSTAPLILPMVSETSAGVWPRPRRLGALANFYSSLFGPLTKGMGALQESDWNMLIQQIATERPAWDIVTIGPMANDDPAFKCLGRALEHNGMLVQEFFCFGNWYSRIGGRSFSEYWSSLPPRTRNTVERRRKKLTTSSRLRLRVFTESSEVEEGIACYEQVYGRSWKTPEPLTGFMPELIRMCIARGWARLGVAYIDDSPAAAQFWIVHNNVASIYKLAYDERYAQYSIGTILTSHLLEHVIDTDRVEEVDYLTGDDAYKADWMEQRRERWGLVAFNRRTWKGRLYGTWHVGGRAVKRGASAILRHTRRTWG
jgi:hypothetical protein